MFWNATSLRRFAVEATDGAIGTVSDLLFDDARAADERLHLWIQTDEGVQTMDATAQW